MRLDKFLKVSRLIKQRERAKELCDAGSVSVNGHEAKASKIVAVGDIIDVTIRDRTLTAQILQIPQGNVSKSQAKELVSIQGESQEDEI